MLISENKIVDITYWELNSKHDTERETWIKTRKYMLNLKPYIFLFVLCHYSSFSVYSLWLLWDFLRRGSRSIWTSRLPWHWTHQQWGPGDRDVVFCMCFICVVCACSVCFMFWLFCILLCLFVCFCICWFCYHVVELLMTYFYMFHSFCSVFFFVCFSYLLCLFVYVCVFCFFALFAFCFFLHVL